MPKLIPDGFYAEDRRLNCDQLKETVDFVRTNPLASTKKIKDFVMATFGKYIIQFHGTVLS